MNSPKAYFKFFITAITAVALFTICGCGESTESAQQQTISFKINVDDEKKVFIDNFMNLTDNEDLDIFEESIPAMIDQSLTSLTNVYVIPRHTVLAYQAIKEGEESPKGIIEAARDKGARYVVNGWMEAAGNGTYRIYANLVNTETNNRQASIAVAEFKNSEEALPKLKEFVLDVSSKLGKSSEEIQSLKSMDNFEYDFFKVVHKTINSYNKGRPDISISMIEKTLQEYIGRLDHVESDKEKENINRHISFSHYLLAQLYSDLGKDEKARRSLEYIYPQRHEYTKQSIFLIEAIWEENEGNYDSAEEKFIQLIKSNPYERYYYIRLAGLKMRRGDGQIAAIKVLEQGMEKIPDSAALTRKLAELRMDYEGERVFERYAKTEKGFEKPAITSEVVAEIVNNKMEEAIVRSLPTFEPIIIESTDENATFGELVLRVGELKIDAAKLEKALDYSCPDTTDGAIQVAVIAVRNGNIELAHKIAMNIKKHGTAANSKDAYHIINSTTLISEGNLREAKSEIMLISKKNPARYLAIGNMLTHQGEHKKAVEYMEKALKMNPNPHPLLYYKIANSYMLAGMYKQWNYYNVKFLQSSADADLIPEGLKVKIDTWAPPKPPKTTKKKPADKGTSSR